ncbi:peptidoglycan DD-metalloendopeptidase family protein [Candidatus Peregrinibacteria bacterium]|nr:peptidoglycan DD-metalloendopeptidase family protein [Candidatus Peregrinibacteria bacterium]
MRRVFLALIKVFRTHFLSIPVSVVGKYRSLRRRAVAVSLRQKRAKRIAMEGPALIEGIEASDTTIEKIAQSTQKTPFIKLYLERYCPTFYRGFFLISAFFATFYKSWKTTMKEQKKRRYFLSFFPESSLTMLPSRFMFKRMILVVLFFFVFGSFQFGEAYYEAGSIADYSFSLEEAGLVMDGEGYLTKMVPPETSEENWIGLEGTHVVQPGETLSEIASAYGLKSSTLIWENNLEDSNLLTIGQKLSILPQDGVTYNVKKGDTLEKVGGKFKIDGKLIAEANNLSQTGLLNGTKIFIPGGKQIYEESRAIAFSRDSSSGRSNGKSGEAKNTGGGKSSSNVGTIAKVNITPKVNKKLIFPTTGKFTQGYHASHLALDISDTSRPPIWAAADGTVIKAATGWNGGYGNHVIIDHGNGLQTLYAHMERFYVNVGDVVTQGQIIGKQGNTGRVYGVTGIHLHFEVRDNGVKRNPANYY